MCTSIRAVTSSNKKQVLQLNVAADQQGFIESVSQCLQDAEEDSHYVPLALYNHEQLIGFAMYGDFEGDIWLDRYLIDERFQGQGLGRAFFNALVEFLNERFPHKPLYLSVFKENVIAIRLYETTGFSFTHKLDENGEHIMMCPYQEKAFV